MLCVFVAQHLFVVIDNWYIPFLLLTPTGHPTAGHLALLGAGDTDVNQSSRLQEAARLEGQKMDKQNAVWSTGW